METAMERKAIWERDTALESAVEGHCSPPERRQDHCCFKCFDQIKLNADGGSVCWISNHFDWISPPPPSRLMYITPCFPFTPASLFDLIFIWKRRWLVAVEEQTSPSVFCSHLFSLSPPGLHPPPFDSSRPAKVQIYFCFDILTVCQPIWFIRIL